MRVRFRPLTAAPAFTATALMLLAGCASRSSSEETAPTAGEESALETSGEPALVVPLIDEKKKLLSRYNADARSKGLKEMPDTLVVKSQADASKYDELRTYFDDKIEPAVHAKDQAMPAWGPDSYTNWSKSSKTPGLCYRGEPKKVMALLEDMASTVFSEQMIVHGWRYKNEKHFGENDEGYADDFPDVWKEWSGNSSALLVVTSINDDGDSLSPAIIPRCKK